ncbi:MAG: helix-turn-helix domain-containing protein [Winogradskyella sp.]|nr:helix-turn-helix domain-containing protein [Winogradskyella sp.]
MSGLRSSTKFSLQFKLKIIEEARREDISLTELSRKYGIQGHSTIRKWIRKLEGKSYKLSKKTDHELKRRIKDLEKLLDHERLKRLAAEQMIEVAEEELKISIRKKSDSKQSNV